MALTGSARQKQFWTGEDRGRNDQPELVANDEFPGSKKPATSQRQATRGLQQKAEQGMDASQLPVKNLEIIVLFDTPQKCEPKQNWLSVVPRTKRCGKNTEMIYKNQNDQVKVMLDNSLQKNTRYVSGKWMLFSGLLLSFTPYIASTMLEHKYDWDIDQFILCRET